MCLYIYTHTYIHLPLSLSLFSPTLSLTLSLTINYYILLKGAETAKKWQKGTLSCKNQIKAQGKFSSSKLMKPSSGTGEEDNKK